MSASRLPRILALLNAADSRSLAHELCAISAEVVDVSGAGVMVEGENRAPLCASDAIAARIEDLCLTTGEGPGVDAHVEGVSVFEPDLANPRHARWPGFSPGAVDAGAAAIFSFPLRVGSVRLGALTLYRVRPGTLSDDQHSDARAMATVVVNAVLAHQADAPPGTLATELEELSGSRAEVHQASGMVSAQLGVTVADALVRLRAHAYAEGRTLFAVASDVVGRRMRFTA